MDKRKMHTLTRGIAAGLLLAASLATAAATENETAAETAPRVMIGFGTGIDREARTLVAPADTFAVDTERVWCLTRVIGLEAPTTVTHVWYHDGTTRAKVDLDVGSADWRTWSSKTMLPGWTGTWEVRVLDAGGTVLGSETFAFE